MRRAILLPLLFASVLSVAASGEMLTPVGPSGGTTDSYQSNPLLVDGEEVILQLCVQADLTGQLVIEQSVGGSGWTATYVVNFTAEAPGCPNTGLLRIPAGCPWLRITLELDTGSYSIEIQRNPARPK